MNSTNPPLIVWTLPAYWASYLVNGDATGLDVADMAACTAFLKREALRRGWFTGCGEQYFAHTNDAGTLAGDVCEFTYLPTRLKTVSFREEFYPSLPHVETASFIDGRKVGRAEFMTARGNANRAGQVIAEETHSAGGKTVRYVLAQIP